MDVESVIRARRTHKQYGPEPVAEAVVRELVDLARWAPNHKLTNPWRFRLLGPETRARIDELVSEAEVIKLRRAPTLVLVTAVRSTDPVLAEEDVLVALVHLGSPVTDPPPKERAPVEDVFTALR
jgi:nitroreductase